MNIRSLIMRWLACVLLFVVGLHAKAQYVYKIKADTVRIYNTCDSSAELVLQNRTQNVLGYLYNKGDGVTEFRALGAVDSMYRRNDTLFYHTADGKIIPVKMDLSSVYDLKATNFVSVAVNDSANISKLPIQKVVGVGATNALDMPPLSNQAYYGANSTLYYQGFAVTDGASAVNMMVNWNGELKGPNGAFIRIKDDNRTTWSNWRELVFKDFSDSIYARSANVVPTTLPTFYGQDWNSFNGTTKAGFITGDINAPTASTLYFGLNIPNTTNQYGAQLAFRNGTGFFRTLEAGGYGDWLQLADRPWTNAGFIQNQNVVAQTTSNFWISGQGTMKSLAVAAPNDNAAIVYHTGSYVPTQANRRWTQYLRAAEGTLNSGSDLTISRYDSVGNFISEAMTIQRATGNVGIGTTSPAEKLHVAGNIRSTGSLLFDRPLSAGNVLMDFQQGYQLYSDTLGALNAGGTRLWFAGPDKGSIVFSPRAGAYYFNMIRVRADTFRLENGSNKWIGIASLGTDAYGNLTNTSGSVIQNQNATVQGSANYVISGRGTSQSIGTFQAAAGPPHWVLFNGSNANTAVRWSVSMKNTESTNDNGADFTIDRYDSTGTIIDNVFFGKRSTGYVGIGTSSPAQKLDVNGGIKANSLVTYGGGASATAYGHYWLGNSSGITRWRFGIKGQETGSGNVGSDFDISPYTDAGNINTSVSAFTIQRSTGNVGINNASPAQRLDVIGSVAASASVITPAITAPTASSDLTLQAGNGSAININSTLKVASSVQLPQKTVSASYTLTSTDYTIFCSATGVALTLPAASAASGRVYEIVNASSGSVTISAVQVYATATTSIPTNTSWRIQSDGTNWRLVFRSN